MYGLSSTRYKIERERESKSLRWNYKSGSRFLLSYSVERLSVYILALGYNIMSRERGG